MIQKQDHPCDSCCMGWANQDADGKIDSCKQTCNKIFSRIVDRHLVEYKDVWEHLAKL